ncbi:MAG: Holliday junction resolvase RuvX [Oscillospiraceae bacterium]|nr:Holliday junction resolvase RuvX [Oscillospiraceae bacterium]
MKILAVDLGRARTGLAICDENEVLATPAGVIPEWNRDRLAHRIAQETESRAARMIVVGLPRNMDGSEGTSAQEARSFAESLRSLVPVPVVMQDERGTTITAHSYLNDTNTRGKKRKAVVDAVAATVILQDFLTYRKNRKARAGHSSETE